MGLFDKLKEVFFEDAEDQEVEEEKVARKIKSPTLEEKKETLEDLEKEVVKEKTVVEVEEEQFSVPFDDADFEVEKTIELEDPIKEDVRKVEYRETVEVVEPKKIYGEEVKEDYRGFYEEAKEEKKRGFAPTPVISPVFGVLDKNYDKDEIVQKSEVRLSQTSFKKADLDSVRERVFREPQTRIERLKEEVIESVKEEPGFYDLSEDSPTVKEVTLGDAEEYFTDLGLEYNVDYKVEEEKKDVEYKSRSEKNKDLGDDGDKHLFDLIDSIYERKE